MLRHTNCWFLSLGPAWLSVPLHGSLLGKTIKTKVGSLKESSWPHRVIDVMHFSFLSPPSFPRSTRKPKGVKPLNLYSLFILSFSVSPSLTHVWTVCVQTSRSSCVLSQAYLFMFSGSWQTQVVFMELWCLLTPYAQCLHKKPPETAKSEIENQKKSPWVSSWIFLSP